MRGSWAAAALCLLLTVLLPRLASAQGAMSQGEATIAVRSDVKLGVKGTAGTTKDRLAKLGQAVSDQMGEIRACYRKQVDSSPEVIGAMKIRIALDKTDTPQIEITQQEDSTKQLLACVSKVLKNGKYKDVGRPAAAMLSLEFDNSRARGEAAMQERKEKLGQAPTAITPEGGQEASWSSEGGELRVTVRTPPAAPSGATSLVLRGFAQDYAAFLDCRRKCEKGGVSAEGTIEAELSIDAKGKAKTKLGAISVTHARAPVCGDKAFKRVHYERPAAPVEAHVSVYFAP